MRSCALATLVKNKTCDQCECRLWIDYEEDLTKGFLQNNLILIVDREVATISSFFVYMILFID